MIKSGIKYKKANNYVDVFQGMKQGLLPFAGGTDVMIKLKEGFLRSEGLLYIGDMLELKGIEKKEDSIFIGAGEKIADICKDEIVKKEFPGFIQGIELIGSLQIRNQATLGGNLGNCSPVADSIPMLMSLNAKVHIVSENNRKIINIVDFPKGVCQTAMETGEIIEKIEIPIVKNKNIQFYRKFGQRPEVAIQKCSVGTMIELEDDNLTVKDSAITIGAVAVRALRCSEAEEFLKSKKLSIDVIEKAGDLICEASKPISDIRSNKEYRKEMVGVGFIEEMKKFI